MPDDHFSGNRVEGEKVKSHAMHTCSTGFWIPKKSAVAESKEFANCVSKLRRQPRPACLKKK